MLKYCCVRLGNWESFCGMLEKLWARLDRVESPEPSELLGNHSVRVCEMFRGICVSLIWENSWRNSGGRVGRYGVTSGSWVGSLGMEGIFGGEMPFSLK